MIANSIKVSVLIPTYNYARFLDEAIQSVLSQTFANFELVIVDNCSTDNTDEVVQKYLSDSRVSYYKNSTNLGLVGNFNKVLEYAKGEYIKYLMADDKFHPQLLEKFVAIMDTHPEVLLVTSARQAFGSKEKKMIPKFSGPISGKEAIYFSLQEGIGNWIGEPSTVMFRSSATKVGPFDSQFITLTDFDMWLRILAIGDCYVIPEVLSYFRTHAKQASDVLTKNFDFTFEDYRFYKNIKEVNPYKLDLSKLNIDESVKKRATYCADALFKMLPRLRNKKMKIAFKKALKIAITEKVLLKSITKLLKFRTSGKKLKPDPKGTNQNETLNSNINFPITSDPATVKVSVLVPTYNYGRYLDETIQSILMQTYTDFELIIVDNNSTDNTDDVVSKYLFDGRVKYYKNPINLGLLGNWNKCLEYANGEYIKFLCADDKFEPELLEKFVHAMDQNPSVTLVTCEKRIFGEYAKIIHLPFHFLQNGSDMILHTFERYCWIGEPSSVMFRRADLHVGHFSSEYKFCLDWEMWVRLLAIGDCYILPEPLVNIRFHNARHTTEYDGRKFVIYFEEYFLCKAIQGNKYRIETTNSRIDSIVKKKALNCIRQGIFKGLHRLHKKERRTALKIALKIALNENIVLQSLVEIFLTKLTRRKSLKPNVYYELR